MQAEELRLELVEAERVSVDEEDGFLVAFVRDEAWTLLDFFLSLQEREDVPWKFAVDFEEGKGFLEFFIKITAAKPELSRMALSVKFRLNSWAYAKKGIAVFFFSEKDGSQHVNPQGIFLTLPEEVIEECERKMESYEIDLFYDKVLKVGNPYSREYAEGVWLSFVRNRYRGGRDGLDETAH
jgi:hypothetical protein